MFVAINYVLIKNFNILNILVATLFILLIFLSLDIIVQYFNNKDIFGISSGSNYRYSGFMGDEWIAGSFISKFFLLSMVNFIFMNKYKFLNIFLISLFFYIVLLTGERMALFNFLLIIFLLSIYLFYKKLFTFRDIFLLGFSILFILTTFFVSLDNDRKKLYTFDLLLKLKLADQFMNNFEIKDENKKFIKEDIDKNNTHLDLFMSSYSLIKDNLILGIGTNQFYKECNNFKKKKLHCENHSHNLYLNIFSEQGLIILILFFFLIYFYIIKDFFLVKDDKYQFYVLIILITLLNPLSISGDLFSTWTGTIFWYILGLYYSITNNQKFIK